MPFWEYRYRIKEIAEQSWKSAGVRVHLCNMNSLKVKDNDYIIPSDDDDWISPNLFDQLKNETSDFVFWKSITHITYGVHKMRNWHANFPSSNNYAIRGDFFKKAKKQDKRLLIYAHRKSLPTAKRLNGKLLSINKIHSCYNWHPGSTSVLSNKKSPSRHFDEFFPKNFRKLRLSSWADDYVTQFCGILKEIHPKHLMMY